MVRAATTGVIDYTGADPRNRQWRIKHLLLLTEMARKEEYELVSAAHRHWLALVAHGSLTEESFGNAKTRSIEILQDIQKTLFPWDNIKKPQAAQTTAAEEKEAPKSTLEKDILVDESAKELIDRYKELYGTK